jgi:nucleotide-binding universal stress UspA family protein
VRGIVSQDAKRRTGSFTEESQNKNKNEEGRRREMIPQVKKILYATDLSKNSSYAFSFATDMARRHDAKIFILHVIDPLPPYAETFSGITAEMKRKHLEEIVREIKKRLQAFCKKAEAQFGPPCAEFIADILLVQDHPPEEILNAASKVGCDVIVLGTHGKGFLAHAFLGSVSEEVLQRTQKPVFIVPLPSEETSIDWDEIR